MIRSLHVTIAVALLLPCALAISAHAGDKAKDGDKDFSVKSQIVLPIHKVKMIKDQIYVVEVKAKGFSPVVTIPALPFGLGLADKFDDSFLVRGTDYKFTFIPRETKEYAIVVVPSLFAENLPMGPLDYTLSVKAIPVAQKPLLKVTDMLTDKDPKYSERNNYYKAFPIKLKAGETYIIDHVRPGDDFKFDPYLYLEDANKKIVARDDDSGGNLNARIIFTPPADGEFRIIATTLTLATGEFTLTVRGTTGAVSNQKK